VARLSPIEAESIDLSALVAAGIARPSIAPLPADFLKRRLPSANSRGAITEDREDRF
jgi:hypothetical protein